MPASTSPSQAQGSKAPGAASRFIPLMLALVGLGAMSLFAWTPLAWEWAGRPSESYPEVVYGFLGLPAALVAVTAGILLARKRALRGWRSAAAHLAWGTSAALCAFLTTVAIWPLLA